MLSEKLRTRLNLHLFGEEEPKKLSEREKMLLEKAIEFFTIGSGAESLPVYQLKDSDNDDWGLIRTDAPSDEVSKWFGHYYNDDGGLKDLSLEQCEQIGFPEDLHVEGFAQLLQIKGYTAHEFYVERDIYA